MTFVDNPLFTRVVVLAPQARVEVAVPADVALVEVIPMLAAMVGEPADDTEEWRLSSLSGRELDNALSLREIDIADGETLRLARHGPPPPAPVFDDVLDAIADQASRRLDQRNLLSVTGAATVVVSVLLASILIPAVMAGPLTAAALSVLATALVSAAAMLARHRPAGCIPAVTAGAGAPAAFGAGVHLVDAAAGASGAMLGGVAAAGYCVIAAIVTRTGLVALSSIATVAGLTSITGALMALGEVPADRAAVGIAACAVLGMAILPWVAVHVAGLAIPGSAEGHGSSSGGWSGQGLAQAQERTRVALDVLHGTTVGSVVTAAAAASHLGWNATGVELTFAGLVFAALALRMRATVHRALRMAMLAGSLGGLAATLGLYVRSGGVLGLAMLSALLALALGGWMAMLLPSSYRPNPMTMRALDMAETATLIAILPLAGWLTGLFTSVRHW